MIIPDNQVQLTFDNTPALHARCDYKILFSPDARFVAVSVIIKKQ